MNQQIKDFLTKIKPDAQSIEQKTGIPWLFAATQAGHESRWGLSLLTVDANNLFGITGDSWYTQGKPVYWIMTKEYGKDGTPFEIKRPFRKYDSWESSLLDWADLLVRRYPKAIDAARESDFKGFADALQAGGYATDPHYATQLVSLYSDLEGIA